MKTLTITSNLAALSLGALISACGAADTSVNADQAGLQSDDPSAAAGIGEAKEAITACDDAQYDHWRYISALAVAAANELGRWNLTDFTYSNGVQLSPTGLARCKAGTNGCQNVQALLGLQNNGDGVIPRHNQALYKGYLYGFYMDQKDWNLAQGVDPSVLTPTTVSTASCGFRYWYKSSLTKPAGTTPLKSAVSGKCIDISANTDGAQVFQMPCDGKADQSIVLEAFSGHYRLKDTQSGKCFRLMSGNLNSPVDQATCGTSNAFLFDIKPVGDKYQIVTLASNTCLEVSNGSTADAARIVSNNCDASLTKQLFASPLAPVVYDNPNAARVNESLRWVGGAANPYIQFLTSGAQVSVDPMGTMVDGGANGQTGSCTEASSAFDSTRTLAGKCCTYGGKYGKFTAAAWNANLFYCK